MFRPVKIRQYLKVMETKGYSAEKVLAGSGLVADMLSDQALLIDIDQSCMIVANMIKLSGNPAIGLEIGSHAELVDFGLVSYAMMSASTVREALEYWIRYSNTLVGMLIDLQLEISAPDDWSVSISEPAALGLAYRFCIDEQIAQFAKLSGDIVAGHATISRLDLSFPAPEYRQLYENYCSGVIRFNAKRTRISLCCPRLDQPLRGFDREHNEICVRQCKFLVRQILSQTPLQSRINSVLMQSRGSMPTLESTARQLNISPRTLCRRLQEEGSGYQQLVGEFRKKLAKAYLLSSSLAPKEIADLLGFEDVNSFRRAFKSWTGQTIMEYLKAQPQSAEDTSELTPGMSVAGVNPASSMDRFACPEVLSAH